MTWFRSLPPGVRIAVGILAVVVAANVVLLGVRTVVGSGRPGGPPSSSYGTTPEGLAAYARLLARYGHPVERTRTALDEGVLHPDETLVVADPAGLPADEVATIEAFVRAGGRLVALGPGSVPALRPLLGTDVTWVAGGGLRWRPASPAPEVTGISAVEAAGRGSWRAWGSATPLLAAGDAVTAVVADVGRGRVVAVSDPSVLQNGYLGRAGNAAFGIAAAGAGARVVRFAEAPHGFGESVGLGAIPRRWQFAAVVGVLAALVWMWSRGRRFGPPEEPGRPLPPPRRAYVDALAVSLARTRRPGEAYAPLREAVRRRLAASAPDGDVARAATAGGLDEDEVAALLGTPANDGELVAAVRAAAKVRGAAW
jgi:hypothetical protein